MKLVKSDLVNRLRTNPGLWFLIVLSAVFHGVLLSMPMPQWWLTAEDPDPKQKPEDILEESGAISLTTLPVVATPEPEVTEPEEPAPPPESVPEIIEQAPVTEVPEDIPQEPEDINEPEPVPSDPIPGEPTPDPADDEPESGVAFAFKDDFPHADGSEAGCGSVNLENCRTVNGTSFNNIATSLREDLEEQNYTLNDITPEDDDRYENHIIFEIIDPNDPDAEIKYLNVLSEDFLSAFYIITPDILTREELINRRAET